MKPAICALALATVVAFGAPAPSGAEPTGGGELGPEYVLASAADLGAGQYPGSGLPAREPSGESPYSWFRVHDGRWCVVFGPRVPLELEGHVGRVPVGEFAARGYYEVDAGLNPAVLLLDDLALLPADAFVVGPMVYDLAYPVDGGVGMAFPWCPPPGMSSPFDVPTAGDVWQRTPLPRRPVVASPPGTAAWPGITRLATRFTSEPRGPAVAAVSLGDFSVTVTAWPVAYAWSFGDGSTAVVGDPSLAIVPYVRRGDYDVVLYVTWAARAHIVYAPWGLDLSGASATDTDLGTVTVPERRPYHVAEIRSVLCSARRLGGRFPGDFLRHSC